MFNRKRELTTKYSKDQLISVAEWLLNAITYDAVIISKLQDAQYLKMDNTEVLRQQLFSYQGVPGKCISPDSKSIFIDHFVTEMLNLCKSDALLNSMDNIHISFTTGEGYPDAQKILYAALEKALISSYSLTNLYMGCYLEKSGEISAYIKVNAYEMGIHKKIGINLNKKQEIESKMPTDAAELFDQSKEQEPRTFRFMMK